MRVVGAGLAVADHQAGDIDREKAGAVDRLGQAEDHERAGRDERRVQALRQLQPVEHQHHARPPSQPIRPPEHRLARPAARRCRLQRLVAEQQDLDQHDGQEDRERIVDAGFDLERGADARPQPQALGVQQEEHRRGVGRGDHGADQQRLRSSSGPAPDGHRRGQRRGDQRRRRSPACRPAPARCGRSRAGCAGRRRTGSGRAPPSRPCRPARTSSNWMPPGPDSPASMPTSRKTSSSGAPKRSATRLDMMPASTSSAPSRMAMLTGVERLPSLRQILQSPIERRQRARIATTKSRSKAGNFLPTVAPMSAGIAVGAGGMPAIIALAISCSPITTAVAPCFFRCSISASEWARAMIGSAGLSLRPCSTTCPPSKASGIATSRQRAAGRLAAAIDLRIGGVAGDGLEAALARPRGCCPARCRSPAAARRSCAAPR